MQTEFRQDKEKTIMQDLLPNPTQVTAQTKGKKQPLFLYIISICVWMFDFKAETPGQGMFIQAPMLIIYSVAFLIIAIKALPSNPNRRCLWLLLFIGFWFALYSAVVGLLAGQKFWLVFTNMIPTALFMSASFSTYVLLGSTKDKTALLSLLKTACLGFIVFHFIVAAFVYGFELTTSRYQFLSAACVPALAVFVLGAFLRFGKMEILIVIANLLIVLISVTRSQLAIGAGQVALCFACSPRTLFRPSAFKKVIGLALLVAVIISVDIVTDTGMTMRWVERLTINKSMGADPTALTRIAEDRFMLQEFTSTFEGFVFGHGLAAETSLIGPEAMLAGSLVGFKSVLFHSIGFGHNNYLSILFVGGLLSGVPLLVMLLSNGFGSLRLIRILLTDKTQDQTFAYIGLWGALIVIGMLLEGLFGGTFGDRGSCLWYGIGTGMFYWARDELRKAPKKSSQLPLINLPSVNG